MRRGEIRASRCTRVSRNSEFPGITSLELKTIDFVFQMISSRSAPSSERSRSPRDCPDGARRRPGPAAPVSSELSLTRHAAVFTVDCWPKSICGYSAYVGDLATRRLHPSPPARLRVVGPTTRLGGIVRRLAPAPELVLRGPAQCFATRYGWVHLQC